MTEQKPQAFTEVEDFVDDLVTAEIRGGARTQLALSPIASGSGSTLLDRSNLFVALEIFEVLLEKDVGNH
jgi:hypothetical protein